MFHPSDNPMERGWVGRVDSERVVHLAAQTLQAFFLGGGGAREHAEYRLADVTLLAPVLQPPTVRLFEAQDAFSFANASAVEGPGTVVRLPAPPASVLARVAALIGAEQAIGGYCLLAEWRSPGLPSPKDRDFALVLGPLVVTPDELSPDALTASVRADGVEAARGASGPFDWDAARALAAAGTLLRPGDVLAAPASVRLDGLEGGEIEAEGAGIGTLRQSLAVVGS